MPRELILSNGRLLVAFDGHFNMKDMYFPHLGSPNHIAYLGGEKGRIGFWVDGTFTWLDEPTWEIDLGYKSEAMHGILKGENKKAKLLIEGESAVHFRQNIYLLSLRVRNASTVPREVRVFFYHDFTLNESLLGDTGIYLPEEGAIMHYKKGLYFLIRGLAAGRGFYQYAVGNKRFRGAEGTWRDAEDGRLEGNPVHHGSVDSTVSFSLELGPGEEGEVEYWLVAGRSPDEVRRLNAFVLSRGVRTLLEESDLYWRRWMKVRDRHFADLPEKVVELYKRSLLVVRAHADGSGALLAAVDSDILLEARDHYGYCWPRDGAFAAWAMDQAGYPEVAISFFDYCRRILDTGGYFFQKYNADGTLGSTWLPTLQRGQAVLPIQEDETGLVLWSLGSVYRRTKDFSLVYDLYPSLVRPAARFLTDYCVRKTGLPSPSYDLWEERWGVFTFTAAAVAAGLSAAADLAVAFGQRREASEYLRAAEGIKQNMIKYLYSPDLGRFIRGFYPQGEGGMDIDYTLDASLLFLGLCDMWPDKDPRVERTVRALEEGLRVRTRVGGLARYTGDYYFRRSEDLLSVPGNPWLVCTLWLAAWQARTAKDVGTLSRARTWLEWAADRATKAGLLPEQLHPYTGEPLSVCPLMWSHAGLISAVEAYLAKWKTLSSVISSL